MRKEKIDKIKKMTREAEAMVIAGGKDKDKLLAGIMEIREELESFKY